MKPQVINGAAHLTQGETAFRIVNQSLMVAYRCVLYLETPAAKAEVKPSFAATLKHCTQIQCETEFFRSRRLSSTGLRTL